MYQVGDKLVIDKFYINIKESKNVCIHAISSMLTLLSAFIHGASAKELGIGTKEDTGYIQCPDPGSPDTQGGTIIFEVRREVMGE